MKINTKATLCSFLVAGVLVATGCGSDDASSSTTAVASESSTLGGSDAQLCAARESLKTSVAGVATAVTGLASTGTSGVQTAIDAVKTDLASVKQLSKEDVAPQVEATETALTDLETAVADGGSGGVVEAATALATSAAVLLDSLNSLQCS
jgi:hypothetical protein